MSDWEINWKHVAQEAEKVRDLALANQETAIRGRVSAEEALDVMSAVAAMRQREHAALLADANAARHKAEQESDLLRRQIELVKPSLERMLCEDCPMGGDCVILKINADGSLTCGESIFRWAAQQAKEAKCTTQQ
jgi:hypothetical protein